MKISVIVPIYGVERYLRQCLDSIASQSFSDFEVILVDDGGKDGCPAICDDYAARDSRFKVIHKANAGYGAAVNSGLTAARGEWIGIVEPDDWIAPDMYETLLSVTGDDVDIVKANFTYIHPWGICRRGINLQPPARPFSAKEYPDLLTVHPSIWTCIYRASFLRDAGIRMKEIPGAGWADNPFLYETLCQARKIAFVDKPVYFYRSPFEDPIIARSNWQVPHGRLMEIFARYHVKGIDDAGLWDGLHQRALYCLAMMALMRKDRVAVRKAMSDIVGQIDPRRLNASGILRPSTLWKYRLLKDHRILAIPVIRLYLLLKKAKMFVFLPLEKARQKEGER